MTKAPIPVSYTHLDLGDRPVEFLKHVDSGSSGYAPVFYTAAIKFYVNTSRGGVARDIQIRQRNIGRESTIGFDRLLLLSLIHI